MGRSVVLISVANISYKQMNNLVQCKCVYMLTVISCISIVIVFQAQA